MNLDFTAITNAPNYASEKKAVESSGKNKAKVIYLLLIIPIFWIPLIFWAISKIPAAIKQAKQRTEALRKFAEVNGFTYTDTKNVQTEFADYAIPYDATPLLPMKSIKGVFMSLPFEYVYADIQPNSTNITVSSSSSNTRGVNIFRVQLPLQMPGLFADSKFNDIFGFNFKVNKISQLQKYDLEGDFPQHYSVYAEKDTQIDVLSILSPEVMQALIHNYHYDLWIHDNELMLIAPNATEVEFFAASPLIFKNIELLLLEIDKIARVMSKLNP